MVHFPVDSCEPQVSTLHNFTGDGSLHIIATSTPETCKMLACWLMWIRRMMMRDTRVDHQLHVKTYVARGVSAGDERLRWKDSADPSGFLSPSYNSATASKAGLIGDVLKTLPDTTTVIFTDLDIIPLELYSRLPDIVPPRRELTFMYNNIPHEAANTGFMLMRNSPALREFMDVWKETMVSALRMADNDYTKIRPPFDQKMANNVLHARSLHYGGNLTLPSGRHLPWGVFDNSVVTGIPTRVERCTYAYHAISVGNHSRKLERLNQCLAKKRAASIGRLEPVWQRECSEGEQASCEESVE